MGFAEEAKNVAERQKDAGADQLQHMADAVHAAAREVEGQLPPAAADYIRNAATRLEDAVGSLKEKSVDDLMKDFSRFASERPALLFGGAVFAGLALSRFLKSSADETSRSETNYGGA
jgi:hypothetical protein